VFVGVPLLQLEMGIGQVFKRATTQAFGKIHERWAGIGAAATFVSFIICGYYTVRY
jgi:SNF family Na+-dependent transporter